jgi:hypothetical protein
MVPRATNVRGSAFIKESRIELADAKKIYRKSGGSPQSLFASTM